MDLQDSSNVTLTVVETTDRNLEDVEDAIKHFETIPFKFSFEGLTCCVCMVVIDYYNNKPMQHAAKVNSEHCGRLICNKCVTMANNKITNCRFCHQIVLPGPEKVSCTNVTEVCWFTKKTLESVLQQCSRCGEVCSMTAVFHHNCPYKHT